MENVYEEKYKGCIIEIANDDMSSESPDDWDNENVFLVNFHRDFEVRNDDIIVEDKVRNWHNDEKIEQEKNYWLFALNMYSHSGVALSLSSDQYPFNCRWDSSRVGMVLVKKTEAKTRKKAEKLAQGLIKNWNDYLSGNVYGFMARDEKNDYDIDSCWGFYGDWEKSGILEKAQSSIDYYIKEERAKIQKQRKEELFNKIVKEIKQNRFEKKILKEIN